MPELAATQQPLVTSSEDEATAHHLSRQLNLRDLVFAQILSVVGSAWVGIAAGIGHAQMVVWLLAITAFYLPMAAAVYYLNGAMPLEGGLYTWARRGFGDTIGFLTAWNIWAYGLLVIATIFSQLPSEFAYMLGPRFAWVPESRIAVLTVLLIITAGLAAIAIRGLALGKWVHNLSSAAMILAFGLLILSPFWAMLHHAPIHYHPVEFHLPPRNLTTLALIGQILFASSGLEYVAILAGETRSPLRNISRSVIWATPLIVVMFVAGTASVLSFHELHPGTRIDYVAPIPQTLALAFGQNGPGAILSKLAILLLQFRILGAASFIFTGAVRLPMTAGWDHLIPAWFSRLHPRFRTPSNSIYFGAAVIAIMLVLARMGTHASEAFAILNNASTDLYGLAYVAMFAIPLFGAVVIRSRIPRWAAALCVVGTLSVLFSLAISAYPFLDVPQPLIFAIKIIGATIGINLFGYIFYKLRNRTAALPAA
jgi:amino acid transporter